MFTVDERCIRCGLCADLCPAKIIKFDSPTPPYQLEEDDAKCIRCGQCVAFCPESCCFLDFQPTADRVSVGAALFPDAESAETLLRSRRSIRRYRNELLDDESVLRLLETTRYAPSASNSQAVRWVVIKGKERMTELGALVVDAFRAFAAANPEDGNACALLGVASIWDRGVDIIFRGAPQLAVALVEGTHRFPEDGAIALTYFELAAHANWIGCCWGGFFTMAARQSPEIACFLGTRDGEFVAGAQMFGYPDGIGLSHILPPRKAIDVTWI